MTQDENRREYERLLKEFKVEINRFEFPLSSQSVTEVKCADISAGGLQIKSPVSFAEKDKVLVKVYIDRLNKYHPGFFKTFESDVGQYLKAIAEVVWKESIPGGSSMLGLRFIDVDQDDWNALNTMIKKQTA